MSYADDAKTLLQADGTWSGYITGGTYTFAETGRNGIGPTTTPGAYSGPLLKPTAILKLRDLLPFGGLRDASGKYATTRQILEVWVYDDGNADYTTVRAARQRAYDLLNETQLTGTFQLTWERSVQDERDDELRAIFERDDYAVHAARQSSS